MTSDHVDNIVEALLQHPKFQEAAEERNWLVYALEARDGKKPLKVPQLDGRNASYKDAAKFTLDEALEISDHVGYVARKGSALVGIDYDNCVQDDEVDDDIDALLDDVYCEISPSGKGVRVLLPRTSGDLWSRERDDIGFFGSDSKWFTVTFDSLYDEPTFGDSEAVRKSTDHLRQERRSERNDIMALRGKRGDGGKWWFDLPFDWQEEALRRALGAIPTKVANNDDDWYQLSMALHSTGQSWVKGIWDEWSKLVAEDVNPDSYNEHENEVRWNSFKREANGKSVAHVFYVAREHGWDQDGFKQQYQNHINPPVAPSDDEFIEIDLDELKATELPDIDFIVDDVFPSRNLIGLAGPSGAGKTRFTAALVAAMASGNTDIIGLPKANRAVRTLYCANEERGEDLQRRIKAAAMLNRIPSDMHLVVRGKDRGTLKLVDKEGNENKELVDFLIKKANEEDIELIIFDPFVTLGSAEENAAEGVSRVIDAMQRITQESDAAVMFIHHTPKGDRSAPVDEMRGSDGAFRGSGAIYSSLDVGLTLFPYLPPSAHDPKEGKGYRRALMMAQRTKSVAKYIVLDPAKNREGDAIAPVIYKLAAHEVRIGGKPIGAIQLVDQKEADWACDRAVEMGRGNRDMVLGIEVARVLAEHWGVGRHEASLSELLEYLAANLNIWAEEKGKIRADRGQGGKLIELLATPIQSGTVSVVLEREGKSTWLNIL